MKNDSVYIQQIKEENDYLSQISRYNTDESEPEISQQSDFVTTQSDNNNNPGNLSMQKQVATYSIWVLAALIAGVIIWLVIRSIRMRNKGHEEERKEELPEIPKWEKPRWNDEITAAYERGDFTRVIELCYLRWLDTLEREGTLVFEKWKTPGMILDEVRTNVGKYIPSRSEEGGKIMEKTRELTNCYLLTRYGHRAIDAAKAKETMEL